MKTLEVSIYDTGDVMDRVYLHPDGRVEFETGAARPMFDTLTRQGMTDSEAFEARTGWSNGYIVSTLAP